jgi:hypothetical protein
MNENKELNAKSSSLKTTHHQKRGGVGRQGFAFDLSGNWKPETGNSLVFIYPKTGDIGGIRT